MINHSELRKGILVRITEFINGAPTGEIQHDLVTKGFHEAIVQEIHENTIVIYVDDLKVHAAIMHLKPIPITGDWLLKLDFEKKEPFIWHGNGQGYNPYNTSTEQRDFVKITSKDEYFVVRFQTHKSKYDPYETLLIHNVMDYYPQCEHLIAQGTECIHRLQNLFYELYDEELTLKEHKVN